jgi:hypothetical protein
MKSGGRSDLEAAGWEKRFVTDRSRVEEFVSLYTEMSFEVMAIPYVPEEHGECDACMEADPGRLRVIFTRKSVQGSNVRHREERDGYQG